MLSFLLITLSLLLLCASYSSNAVMTVISIFIVVLLYYLHFLCMSNTLTTVSFSSQNNPVRRGFRVGLLSSVLIKGPRLRELVTSQG